MLKVIFLLLLFVPMTAMSQSKTLLVLGGGGDPKVKPDGTKNNSTIFDESLENLSEYTKKSGRWKIQGAFNGGHEKTEAIVSLGLGLSGNTQFSAANFEKQIADLEMQIKSKKITRGSQVLITLLAHGAIANENEQTHGIATSDGVVTNFTKIDSTTVSLDRLQSLVKLAEAEGIKLGILDMSCHSGNAIKLSGPNTCVVSATGPQHFGYIQGPSFISQFMRGVKPGRNLEDVYLEARRTSDSIDFPLISTSAGKELEKKFYNHLSPYLYFSEAKESEKLRTYLEEDMASGQYCVADEKFLSLIIEAEKLVTALSPQVEKDAVTELRSALKDYHAYQNELRKGMESYGFQLPRKNLTECAPVGKSTEKYCNSYVLENLLTSDFNRALETADTLIKFAKSPRDREMEIAKKQVILQFMKRKAEFVRSNPKFTARAEFWKTLPEKEKKTEALAGRVAKAHRKLYDHLYRKSAASGPNPCRDFVL